MKSYAFLAVFFLFLGAASGVPLTVQQPVNLSFAFTAPLPVSSVFVYFPENWRQASPNDFSCPVDWFKNADTNRRIHCACPAPCTNFLEAGFIGLTTVAPSTPETYAFTVLSYPQGGSLAANASVVYDVQNPPELAVDVQTPGSWLVGFPNAVNVTVKNTGQATARDVRVNVRGQSAGIPVDLKGAESDAFTLEGNESHSVQLQVTPLVRADDLDVTINASGVDANSGQAVTRTHARSVAVLEPASLHLRVVPPSRTTYSAGESVTIGVHVQNEGETAAHDVNLTLHAGSQPIQNAFLSALEPGESQPILFAPATLLEETGQMRVTAKFVEQTLGLALNAISASVPLTVERPATLRLQFDPVTLEASASKRVEAFLFNDGQAVSQDTQVVLLDVSGGCHLIGLKDQPIGELGEDGPSVTDWVIQAPPYAAECKAYFQAQGVDENAQTTVQTPIFELSLEVIGAGQEPSPTAAPPSPTTSTSTANTPPDLSVDAMLERLAGLISANTNASNATVSGTPLDASTPTQDNATSTVDAAQSPITGLVAFTDNPILLPLGIVALLALLFATEWHSRKGFRKKEVDLIELEDDDQGLHKDVKK